MTAAYNVVRFRVKAGREGDFIDKHRRAHFGAKGFRGGALIKTGDNTFCIVGEWASFKALADARPQMIAILESFRDDLEDLGAGLGLTDPVSGDVVVRLAAAKPAKKRAAKKAKKAKRKKQR